jgi:hypothetical protein
MAQTVNNKEGEGTMAFVKQLFSKVAIALAAGSAEQAARQWVNDKWKTRKQNQQDEADSTPSQDVPTTPPSKFNLFQWTYDKVQSLRSQRDIEKEAQEYLQQSKQTEQSEETPEA